MRRNLEEFAAIPIVLGVIGLGLILFFAADQGAWAWILVGIGLVVLGALVARAAARRYRHPGSEHAPEWAASGESEGEVAAAAPASEDGVYRLLVIADESCTPETFRQVIGERAAGGPAEAFVVAPALGSRLATWTGDEGAYTDAQSHLDATIEALRSLGIDARGRVGPHDPIQAADDGLREFRADELVFATNPADEAKWLEDGVVDIARERYSVPVTHIVVEAAG